MLNVTQNIPTVSELHTDKMEKEFNKLIGWQMEHIQSSVEKNLKWCLWIFDLTEFDYDARKLFESKGYRIERSGFKHSSVYQLSYELCW